MIGRVLAPRSGRSAPGTGAGGNLRPAGSHHEDAELVRLAGDVLATRRGSVAMRADMRDRRLLVLANPKMSRTKIADELRDLADRIEVT